MTSQDKRQPALNDDNKMPFGKYKDETMFAVPASYLIWLSQQDWIDQWPLVKNYIWNSQIDLIEETGERLGFK